MDSHPQNPADRQLGKRIAYWRKKRGLNQTECSARLGVSRNTLNRYEMGRRKLDVGFMREVSRLLGVPLLALLSPREYRATNMALMVGLAALRARGVEVEAGEKRG